MLLKKCCASIYLPREIIGNFFSVLKTKKFPAGFLFVVTFLELV